MARRAKETPQLEDDPLWYKDAIIYQLHVRAYHDSDADGIGDLPGLTEKLPYLADLGVTAVWLLPFYPSPLRDDGYDIAEYNDVNPSYGTLDDFRRFLDEAHRLGLRVITELVINHTSDQHPWFQKSRRAKPGTKWRDFYVWSDTADRYQEARIIFKDFETSNWSWDPVAKAYYWHRFYSHQPDLNFDNPEVQKAVFKALDFWMEMGVDGLRLDAIPYLYEREGTNCENLPETHQFLKKLRAHVDRRYRNRMLLAEANQWPEDSRPYFGDDDECQMAFHFPLMPRLFMSVAMEDRFPIIDIMQQTPDIPEDSQWAVFLRNHDELTLEMVTDEDRDFMWRMYAADRQARINLGIRRRLAPLLGNHRRRIELLNGLLFSSPGTPIIYYGDEIGMGDNIYLGDRNGVRTPMQWSSDRNAGFSRANPQRLYFPVIIDPEYHFESVNVEAQQNNPSSLLWWMKRMITLRRQFKAFGRGTIEFLHPENSKILTFVRRFEDETILVIANLSRFVQFAELDLGRFQGSTPVELFGRARFPKVGTNPYPLTLGPHDFFWFSLEQEKATPALTEVEVPVIKGENWKDLLRARARSQLTEAILSWAPSRRWFGGKAREVKGGSIEDSIPLPDPATTILLFRVDYAEGDPETYVIPLRIGEALPEAAIEAGQRAVARLGKPDGIELMLSEAIWDREFGRTLLNAIGKKKSFKGTRGVLRGSQTKIYRDVLRETTDPLEPTIPRVEQSNTAVRYDQAFLLKLIRKIESGLNPDLEISRFLTEKNRFDHTAPLAGALEYTRGKAEPTTIALMTRFIPSGGDAWQYSLDAIGRFYERVLGDAETIRKIGRYLPNDPLVALTRKAFPELVTALLGGYIPHAELLGQRTAEMHQALASEPDDPAFAPERFTSHYQQSIYQHMRSHGIRSLDMLRKKTPKLQPDLRKRARRVLDHQKEIEQRFDDVRRSRISGLRIRTHGDFHLGQVLYTGNDFIIIDFEGEPARPVSERRIKRSPLRDVAGMLRSFHYAPHAVLLGQEASFTPRPEDLNTLRTAARFWHRWISTAFLKAYLETAQDGDLLPRKDQELSTLLEAYLLEKALYEVGYELNNRPDWVGIPLGGILQLLGLR